jgi:UDP-N-acetylmuramoyl-tripeptide--D-alanyl-D-alanine ligase
MKFSLTLQQLPQIFGHNWVGTKSVSDLICFRQISTDSRSIANGDLFLALRGEQFDGHRFIVQAQLLGAIACVVAVDHSVDLPKDLPYFLVKDTRLAYQQIAHWWRQQLSLSVIAVTGSVGKTTTKEFISGTLSKFGKVHRTQANYNNEIGVPKTLLDLETDHQYGVIEMGMRARGEIAELTRIAEPNVSVITNVGTAHIGRLGSEEAIAEAKCELLAEMPPTGLAILNHDSPLLLPTAAGCWRGKTITYGLEGGDLRGQWQDDGTMTVEGDRFELPLPGRHNALNFLAALAVVKGLGLDWSSLQSGLVVDLPGGRSRRYELMDDIVLLDETYNAGLESMLAALQLLRDLSGRRRWAVLGTMKELGDRAAAFHRRVGERVKDLGIDRLWVLVDDPTAQAIAEGAKGVETQCFATHQELIEGIKQELTAGDRLLFKASNSVGLNQVVTAIMADAQAARTSR